MKIDETKVDLTDWTLFDAEDEQAMAKILHRSAKELVNILIREDVRAYFPKEWAPSSDGWNGGDVDDPLTIYMVADEEQKILKKISLTKELESSIEDCEEDGSFAYGLQQISETMKRLSARIDKAIEKHGIDS